MNPPKAFLDACTLVPISLTNVILTASEFELLKPFWSSDVIEEAVTALLRIDPRRNEISIRRRFSQMNEFFPDSLVIPNTAMLNGLDLPDFNDGHVIAGAIAAQAQFIVTDDKVGFPDHILNQYGITATTPGEFLTTLFTKDPITMTEVLRQSIANFNQPPITPTELLETLQRCWPAGFADIALRHL